MPGKPRSHQPWLSIAGAAFAIGAALAIYVSFRSGCIGDPKSGVFGNPSRALELEQLALLPHVVSVLAGGMAVAMLSRSRNRVAYAVGFAILAFVCLWILEFEAEGYGVQACFGAAAG
ncbi:MAG TPA: hypothetical protein VK832_04975 [Burkholderiaceae bacterium]|jgi:hypothetical protein|nr:hypothetical protein [Burkholderiaceae bacterium]